MTPDEPLLDQALLDQAYRALGTSQTRDLMEQALAQAIQQAGRDHAIAGELARFSSGRYAGLPADRAGGAGWPRAWPGSRADGTAVPEGPGVPSAPEAPSWPEPPEPPEPPRWERANRTDPAADPVERPAGLLIDTSALAVAHRPAAGDLLGTAVRHRVARSCSLLDAEALLVARSPDEYAELARVRRRVYRSVPQSAAIGERMLELQAVLARRAHLGAATPGDLQVAATALAHGLRVLHHSPALALLGQLCHLDETAVLPVAPFP